MDAEIIHRLWTVISFGAAGLCAAGLAREARQRRAERRRLCRLLGPPADRALFLRPRRLPAPRSLLPFAALIAGPILLGGVAGWLAGLAVAWGMRRWLGRPRDGPEAVAEPPELPLAADLLAACLAAGAGPGEAAREVGRCLEGAVAGELARGAGELRLGGDPAQAWAGLAALPGAATLANCLEQSAITGVPVVDAVSRLAAESRAERTRTSGARARRAAVQVAGPLGLCFLPAFLGIGVAPVVMGLAARVLSTN